MKRSEANAATTTSLRLNLTTNRGNCSALALGSPLAFPSKKSVDRHEVKFPLLVHRMLQEKMACSYGLFISFFYVIPGLASPLQELPAILPAASRLLPASNLSALTKPNASSPDNPALVIRCSGEHFGFNPDLTDCGSAKEYITPDIEQRTWGARHSGLGPETFPLPFRMMGG